jgi:hypothetical protein
MVESESGGGVKDRRSASGRLIVWRLQYDDLSDAEAMALEQFYTARSGGLEAFTFVDPLANALTHSESPDGSAWQGTGASPATGTLDWNGHKVISMAGSGWLSQSVEVAGGLAYCASVWVKGAAGGGFRVDLAANPVEIQLNGSWQRCWSAMAAAGTDGVVPVRFENLGISQVEIAGMCVEGQPYPGESRMSSARMSLYREARFKEGGFKSVPMGPNRNSVQVTVEAALEEQA